jgi:hypothetical protein
MKHKPWVIILFAAFHFIAPLGNLLLSSYVNSIGLLENISLRFRPENLADTAVFFLLPMLAGYSVYLCKRWSYYLYLATMTVITISVTYFWYQTGGLLSIWPLLFVYVFNISIVSYFLIPAVRQVYFNPRLRWWESKPRYHFEKDAKILIGEHSVSAQIKNISETGAFLTADQAVKDGESAKLEFEQDGAQLEIPATLIVHEGAKDLGAGLQFQHSSSSRHQLAPLIAKLDAEGKVIESRRPTAEDAFQYWAKGVFKSKQGLIPKVNR